MNEPAILRCYLDEGLRQSAADGQHNFLNKVAEVVTDAGFRVEYRANSMAERAASVARRGYTLFHMDDPFHDRSVTIRRVYYYPFWAIERSAKRWDWHVAQSRFSPQSVPRAEADRFCAFWRKRLFGSDAIPSSRDGFVYVPLQGRVLEHRSFQACSPFAMLEHVLDHDTDRPIIATLHPNETYTPQELQELDALVHRFPRLSLRTGQMETLLRTCDYIVTQNSSAAFAGYFFGKPCALFGQIDFHHIAANVLDLGVAQALAQAPHLTPDYAGYLHWFWQVMSINAGRTEATGQIRAALLRAGWPV